MTPADDPASWHAHGEASSPVVCEISPPRASLITLTPSGNQPRQTTAALLSVQETWTRLAEA